MAERNVKLVGALSYSTLAWRMDQQLKQWKFGIERLWSAPVLDYRAARSWRRYRARRGGSAVAAGAAQALPNLRAALLKKADRGIRDLARRRLSVVRDYAARARRPAFRQARAGVRPLAPEERHRQLLGLPLGRRLFAPKSSRPTSAPPDRHPTPAVTRSSSRTRRRARRADAER